MKKTGLQVSLSLIFPIFHNCPVPQMLYCMGDLLAEDEGFAVCLSNVWQLKLLPMQSTEALAPQH